ncbi:hypothetical protein SISSUDRAFT_1120778 [Sistotremastrum suecicum HHB10207 ss-3]|uniref:Uncharacterized protein n=1 Tax=Sistotremastrum suecicum HHB10207 ss-3 TaxID=1314776 RepID=A0A166BRQ9_9AGAM|nr:hypothetical protein SISSUDRAFT_1120778 [Sistotremastrum suecicum HHB10207 ss-3]
MDLDLQIGDSIDHLTSALTLFSRPPTPDPRALSCCCQRADCENVKAWLALKAKLESRLVLAAQVGQALLERHEQFVQKQHELSQSIESDHATETLSRSLSSDTTVEDRVTDLTAENRSLRKTLTHALANAELTESSHRTVLHELEETRSQLSRLTLLQARSATLDERLRLLQQENDDLRQERDQEAHRSRSLEGRLSSVTDRMSKMRTDVERLRHERERERAKRESQVPGIQDLSEKVLTHAKTRLEALQLSLSQSNELHSIETTHVLETLVKENEQLRLESSEMQKLLHDAREEVRAIREEVEEGPSIVVPRFGADYEDLGTASSSWTPSSSLPTHYVPRVLSPLHELSRRSSHRRLARESSPCRDDMRVSEWRLDQGVLTPESSLRPLSPIPAPSPLRQPRPLPYYPSNHQHSPPLQSKGVQTEPWWSGATSPRLSEPEISQFSQGSSRAESATSLGALIERVNGLLSRLVHCDVPSLSERLKRQHLLDGADIAHVSRSSVGGILVEVDKLRYEFKIVDESGAWISKKEWRGLMGFIKNTFDELGEMRIRVNDSDLNLAGKGPSTPQSQNQSWMGPLSKLFAGSSSPAAADEGRKSNPDAGSLRRNAIMRSPTPLGRLAPKLGPALGASTTTVNVEFAGVGIRGHNATAASPASIASSLRQGFVPMRPSGLGDVRGIFAGSRNASAAVLNGEPWHVISKKVDAPSPVVRTLRRGLSDSSIHSTFMESSKTEQNATMTTSPSAPVPLRVPAAKAVNIRVGQRPFSPEFGSGGPGSTSSYRDETSLLTRVRVGREV